MALFRCEFMSKCLCKQTSAVVVVPSFALHFKGAQLVEDPEYTVVTDFPTMYLYHGWSDDASCWQRFTGIERYAQERGIAVVMPDLEHSYGVDMANGSRYGSYLSEELVCFTRAMFPLSSKRENTFVAGLSMGGYAALYTALRKPEIFCAAASLSGVTDIMASTTDPLDTYSYWPKVFQNPTDIQGTAHDIYELVRRGKESGKEMPRLFVGCGEQDALLQENTKFVDFCTREKVPVQWETAPGGHEWGYWDKSIQRVIDWYLRTR